MTKVKIVKIELSFTDRLFNLDMITSEYVESVLVKQKVLGKGVNGGILEIKEIEINE